MAERGRGGRGSRKKRPHAAAVAQAGNWPTLYLFRTLSPIPETSLHRAFSRIRDHSRAYAAPCLKSDSAVGHRWSPVFSQTFFHGSTRWPRCSSCCRFRRHKTPMNTRELIRSATSGFSTGPMRCLRGFGLDKAVAAARSIGELRSVTFNADSAEVTLAIRDALHPASGHRQEHFRGLKEGGLKLILKNRFAELKKTREAALRRRKQPEWTDQLILDKDGKIIANLANLILILRESPKWKGVLGYDEFNARVVIRERPPWGQEAPNAPWTDHHEFRRESGSKMRKDQSIGWRCWASSTGSGSTQPVPPCARLFRLACLGWSAPTGRVA